MSRPLWVEELTKPKRLWTRAEILIRPCPVPREPGVYAWFFKQVPPSVPVEGCYRSHDATLLYIGISPKRPPANGAPPSRQRLWNRVRYHLRGNAEGSTLRQSLGCLLAETLNIELCRVGSGKRRTFASGEDRLSEWMHHNALVCWFPVEEPWDAEAKLISTLSLPLNLHGNERHPFHPVLSELRRSQRERADRLPIVGHSRR
jgi:hypothetical protein